MTRILILIALLCLSPLAIPAEAEKPLPADLNLVPPDAVGFLTVRTGDDGFKKLSAVLTGISADRFRALADFGKLFGVATADLERVTVVVRRVSSSPVVVIRTTKAIDRDAYVKKLGRTREMKIAGKEVYLAERGFDEFGMPNTFWLANDRTIVAGTPGSLAGYLGALEAGGKSHPLGGELKAAAGKHTLVLAVRPEYLFRVVAEEEFNDRPEKKGGRDVPKEAPPPDKDEKRTDDREDPDKERPLKLRKLDEILDDNSSRYRRLELIPFLPVIKVPLALLTADIGKDSITTEALIHFVSADDAKDGETVLAMGLLLFREGFATYLRNEVGIDPKEKVFDALVKQVKNAARAVELKRDGKRVSAKVELSLDFAPLMKVIAAEAPVRQEANNLKQIGLAMHNYHDTYRQGPAQAICDAKGKPLLSWRVAILPFIEQDALYRRFKLDEPWNSDHNKKLIPLMPRIYLAPARKTVEPGETFYQVFTGEHTVFPRPNVKFNIVAIADGTSNTIFVAEASKGVPWTKPEDIVLPARGVPKLGGQFKGFFHAVMFDGSVKRVKTTVSAETLRAAITSNGGDLLGGDW